MMSRGRVEDPVHRKGQLDHAEVRAEVPAVGGHGIDDELADLFAHEGEIVGVEAPQIGRT
jgi:hypothetical protein